MGGTSVELATLQDVARFIGHCHPGVLSTSWFVQGEFLFRALCLQPERQGCQWESKGAELMFGLVLAADAAST